MTILTLVIALVVGVTTMFGESGTGGIVKTKDFF